MKTAPGVRRILRPSTDEAGPCLKTRYHTTLRAEFKFLSKKDHGDIIAINSGAASNCNIFCAEMASKVRGPSVVIFSWF
jgi:hypothetical protein